MFSSAKLMCSSLQMFISALVAKSGQVIPLFFFGDVLFLDFFVDSAAILSSVRI